MKTNTLARISALMMSVLFASVATVGVAVMMTSSGEHARVEFNAGSTAALTAQVANVGQSL